MNAVVFACSLVRMRALKLWLATKSQSLCLCLSTPIFQHVFAAKPPNNWKWKKEAMWFQGNLDDWYSRSGRTVVKLPEEGNDPPTIFIFSSDRLAQSHQSQSLRILQYGRRLLSDYAQHHISLLT